MWEKQAVESLLLPGGRFGGLRANLATKGVRLRTRQTRDNLALVQVNGSRQITLFRAQDSRNLHPYPSTHAAALHSQVTNISKLSNGAPGDALRLYGSSVRARRVTLLPGDVLHVPSFWWVHEEALTDCISLSVICTDKKRASAAASLATLPIPLDWFDWEDGPRHCALGRYLASLVLALAPLHDKGIEMPAARAKRCSRWIEGLISSRYTPLGTPVGGGAEKVWGEACKVANSSSMDERLPRPVNVLQPKFSHAAKLIASTIKPLKPSARETLAE
eukprot:COSAG01_NODE_13787_length_1534_cov_129.433449_2_plen_275_part_01